MHELLEPSPFPGGIGEGSFFYREEIMLNLKDLIFFLLSTICFFILLVLFDYFELVQSLNLFLTSFIYNLVNILYVIQLKKSKYYFVLTIPFLILIFILGNINEIFLIYTGIFFSYMSIFLLKNADFLIRFKKLE
ncbi:hypothetical protein SAMN05421731_102377 [Acinetobacter puyangensis]|uniref:Uncharacterized protein n=1 Tax=Acinetobacter puyangensis TaxID=1096779 RepID=A0A240E6L8_9GAMM|nr:hypothetical protein SAMN05421731_102377 [Acinetobacter puyangensis]